MRKRKKSPAWLPAPKKLKVVRGLQHNEDGDCSVIPLQRQSGDRTIRGLLRNTCCDCGLTHVQLFEVFRTPAGDYYLNKRSYRIFKRKRNGIAEA